MSCLFLTLKKKCLLAMLLKIFLADSPAKISFDCYFFLILTEGKILWKSRPAGPLLWQGLGGGGVLWITWQLPQYVFVQNFLCKLIKRLDQYWSQPQFHKDKNSSSDLWLEFCRRYYQCENYFQHPWYLPFTFPIEKGTGRGWCANKSNEVNLILVQK